MANGFIQPSTNKVSFSCPHCGAFAHQQWYNNQYSLAKPPSILIVIPPRIQRNESSRITIENSFFSRCASCDAVAVWVGSRLVFPDCITAFKANSDLPQDIQSDFNEASSIFDKSPRGSAALLRLCIQKMLKHLEVNEKTIDACIARLVEKGLDPLIQQALDSVRVIGNEAVHPGEIDLNDNRDIAESLFGLVNSIAERMISYPKQVKELYNKLPASKIAAIEQRDKSRKD